VGVALLSGFGGANTAKEGEKTTIQETDAEKRTRIWTEMTKLQEKQRKLNEAAKADAEYIKKWQMERYQQVLEEMTNNGVPWAPFKAMAQAAKEARDEHQRRHMERAKGLGGESFLRERERVCV
jgi:crotonobetainyl-CoA:carnitine CoA-transferase CaiB-like acyl-CoA transferase